MQPRLCRRAFLARVPLAAGTAGWVLRHEVGAGETVPPQVMTVLGPIRPDEMGVTLTHEHVLVDFIGADKISRDRYQADDALFKGLLPKLKEEGFRQTEIDQVLVRNPAEAFAIRVRTP